MSLARALLGAPWKTLIRYLHVASDWDTISHDLDLYRKQINDRDEWLATAEARHRDEEAALNQRLVEWQRAANLTSQLASSSLNSLQQATGQLRQLQAEHIKLATDVVQCAVLIAITLHFQPVHARQQQLGVLLPGGRRVVEAGLAAADAIADKPVMSEAMLKKIKEQIVLTLVQIY